MADDERSPLRDRVEQDVYSCTVNEAELGVQQVQLLKLEYTFLLAVTRGLHISL